MEIIILQDWEGLSKIMYLKAPDTPGTKFSPTDFESMCMKMVKIIFEKPIKVKQVLN
jgi:hypothetical protein